MNSWTPLSHLFLIFFSSINLKILLLFSQNPKLAMVVEELKRYLGGGDASIKLHTKFWTAFGHPRPFISQEESAFGTALARLITALALNHTDSQASLRKKVEVLTGSRCHQLAMETQILLATGKLSEAEKGRYIIFTSPLHLEADYISLNPEHVMKLFS